MSPAPSVVVLLVSHDGARWLPTVLEGLASQLSAPQAAVAVDTGSRDDSADLLRAAFGEDRVVAAPSATSYPEAVDLGLAEIRRLCDEGLEAEWVWLLHDDSAPHPEALLALLAGAAEQPRADVLGPMLREWPSLRGILELGVSLSGTGRRETGLERGEFDQGQYVDMREVLAVNTAGMLVRREVLEELGGFDAELPVFGNDIDFGWRAAAAGHPAYVVPQAIVFHAEAAHRGTRRTPLTGRHTHYQERRAALWTLLANGRGSLALQLLRLTGGTVLRMVGLLAVRAPGEALDDLAALVSVARHPRRLQAVRAARRRAATEPDAVRRLLPPWWLPYRHGVDVVRDVAGAVGQQAADVAERRRAAKAQADLESFAARRQQQLDRIDDDDLIEDTGAVARFATNPVAVVTAAFVLAALVASRGAIGDVAGAGLSRVPAGAGDWWSLHLSSTHALGQGSDLPAPASVLPLAVLATLLGGSPAAAVSLLLVATVPLAMWGAWRFLRVTGRLVRTTGAPRWVLAWGSATYALGPVTAGAWGQGRLGPVVAAVLLPWLGHAALGFADPEPDRRWRAAWRSGLLLAVITAFSPVAWVVAVAVGGLVVAAALRLLPGVMGDRSTWGPPAAALAVPVVVLLPWWLPMLLSDAASALLLDAGRLPGAAADGLDLLVGRLVTDGAPWWLGAVVSALAVLALVPRATRIPVAIVWLVASVASVVAMLLSLVDIGLVAGSSPVGQGFVLVLLHGALVTAVSLAAPAALDSLRGRREQPAWRRVAALVAVTAAAGVPLGGLGWFLVAGSPDLDDPRETEVPAYMAQSALEGPERGILVIRGTAEAGLTYTVLRDDGVRLGDDEIVAHTDPDPAFEDTVAGLVGRPDPAVVEDLGAAGIEYVVMPEPADPRVAAELDATGGLVVASAENRRTRAWQVDAPLSDEGLRGDRSWLRMGLLVVQGLALVALVVLCAPTVRTARA